MLPSCTFILRGVVLCAGAVLVLGPVADAALELATAAGVPRTDTPCRYIDMHCFDISICVSLLKLVLVG